jgi:hypothetical protein
MPGRMASLPFIRAAEGKESQGGFIDFPQSGKLHITEGFKEHFLKKEC